MKVLICGGRTFDDQELFANVLFRLQQLHGPFTVIIHGGAAGADRMAGRFAYMNKLPEVIYHANWAAYGRAAGPIRNAKMVASQPDLVVAFPGRFGTADLVRRAKEAGLRVEEIIKPVDNDVRAGELL